MKIYCSLASFLTLTTLALGGPLAKEQVPADVKWLIHLDLDALRATKVGRFLGHEFIEKRLAKPREELKQSLGFELDWTQLNSLTVFGTDYGVKPDFNGVLLVKMQPSIHQALAGLLLKQIQDAKPNVPIRQIQADPPIYSVADGLLIAPQKAGEFLLAKSRTQLQKEATVLAGQGPNLASSPSLADLLNVPKAFFFLGAAEGFADQILSAHGEKGGESRAFDGPLPQAKILRMAEGGHLALGEAKDEVFLNLALKAKTAEASREMQQIVQGILALVALGQSDNPDLQQLAQSTKVTTQEKLMTVNIALPVDKVLEKLGQAARGENGLRNHRRAGASEKQHAEGSTSNSHDEHRP